LIEWGQLYNAALALYIQSSRSLTKIQKIEESSIWWAGNHVN